ARADGVRGAAPEVVFQQEQRHAVGGRLEGGDLLKNVGAVAILVDHLTDAPHLPLDLVQAPKQLVLVLGVAAAGSRSHSCTYSILPGCNVWWGGHAVKTGQGARKEQGAPYRTLLERWNESRLALGGAEARGAGRLLRLEQHVRLHAVVVGLAREVVD